MGFLERVTRRWVVVCDQCGFEEEAVSDGSEYYAPKGWTELRSDLHACTGACRWLIGEQKQAEPPWETEEKP
jgi:hypothetical protein